MISLEEMRPKSARNLTFAERLRGEKPKPATMEKAGTIWIDPLAVAAVRKYSGFILSLLVSGKTIYVSGDLSTILDILEDARKC